MALRAMTTNFMVNDDGWLQDGQKYMAEVVQGIRNEWINELVARKIKIKMNTIVL